MDGFQGAALRIKLRYLEAWTESRRAHAALYDQLLSDSMVQTPPVMPGRRHVYHIYAVRTTQREMLQKSLHEQEIYTGIHYPIPVHLLGAHEFLGYQDGDFPCSEQAANEVLSLPMYAELTDEQVRTVSAAVGSKVHV